MDWKELDELGSELIDDLQDALSDYDYVEVSREGIESDWDTDTAMYSINVEWDLNKVFDDEDVNDDDEWDSEDYGEGDQIADEIESVINGVIEKSDYDITYDWDGSSAMTVALHVNDYRIEDKEYDDDDDDDWDDDDDDDWDDDDDDDWDDDDDDDWDDDDDDDWDDDDDDDDWDDDDNDDWDDDDNDGDDNGEEVYSDYSDYDNDGNKPDMDSFNDLILGLFLGDDPK